MRVRFQQLFAGGDHAHGTWDKETGNCVTVKLPASDQDFDDHLAGKVGLGLVPVTTDGTCRFAAIDIDVDTIDHQALYNKVHQRKMPLNVCRSKSGGAHLYLFMKDPMPGKLVISTMKRWASLLGYPRAEVFPKQQKATKQNLGNWINLPYFDVENTVRYAVGPAGAYTLPDFLEHAIYWSGKDDVDATLDKELIQIELMPPCLASLTKDGLPEGARNQGLFNFATYYRKSSPNGWEEKIVQHNQNYVKPPLSYREVQQIIKSVSGRTYQYTCNQEPICSRCDRKTCLTLKFGVGHEPWKDDATYDDILVSNCRKILTDPPRYILEVNGHDVELSTEQLTRFNLLKDRLFELQDLVVQPRKQDSWDQTLRDLMGKKKDILAPEDASGKGMVLDKINDFLCRFEHARDQEDILRGTPIEKDDKIYFRISDLQTYLKNARFDRLENQVLYQMLHSTGGGHDVIRVKSKTVRVWFVPKANLNIQTEDFTPPVFNKIGEDI